MLETRLVGYHVFESFPSLPEKHQQLLLPCLNVANASTGLQLTVIEHIPVTIRLGTHSLKAREAMIHTTANIAQPS